MQNTPILASILMGEIHGEKIASITQATENLYCVVKQTVSYFSV